MRTPRSKISGKSSLNSSLIKPNLWSINRKIRNGDSIFAATSPMSSARSNKYASQAPPSHADYQPNLVLKQSAPSNDYMSDVGSATSKQSIPYPFLENLLQCNMPSDPKTHIKTKFILEPKREMLRYIKHQINVKRERQLSERQ